MSPERADHAEAPAPRDALTVRGERVSHTELRFAAEATRLPRRLGRRIPVDGFLAWRVYVLLRACWRVLRRLRRE